MALRSLARCLLSPQRPCCLQPLGGRARAIEHHPLHHRHWRRAARSIPMRASLPIRWRRRSDQTIIVEIQARRERQHLCAVHCRSAGRRSDGLDRHAGLHRDQSQRLHQSALVDRRLPADHQRRRRRRWCSWCIRACRRQDLRGVPDLGEGRTRASSAMRPTSAGTPSHFLGFQLNEKFDLDLTHVPYRGSGLQANGADRRPFAVRLRAGQLDAAAKAQPASSSSRQRPARPARPLHAGRADLRRAGPSGIHGAGLVRPAGEGRHAAGHPQPANRSRQGRACRSGGARRSSKPKATTSSPKPGRSFCRTSRNRSCAGANWSKRRGSRPRIAAARDKTRSQETTAPPFTQAVTVTAATVATPISRLPSTRPHTAKAPWPLRAGLKPWASEIK